MHRSITGARSLGRWRRLIQEVEILIRTHCSYLSGIADLAGTAIRHAQLFEQLQAAHQRYQDLFEDSIDPILITNWNGEIVEANRKAALTSDYSKDNLRSMRIDQLHPIDQDLVGKDFAELHSGKTLSYESQLTHCKWARSADTGLRPRN